MILPTIIRRRSAFTLTELLLVILLVGILATLGVLSLSSNIDSERYEKTRAKMEAIRVAILGDNAIDSDGHRTHFGYSGDIGSLPAALSDLVTQPAGVAAWAYDATYGFGAGWRGPYVSQEFTASSSITLDAWGRAFVYAPGGSPATLTSLGADGALGGTGLNADLVIQFPSGERVANVRGVVADRDTRLPARTVEIRYPVAGTITAFTTTTSNPQADFAFAGVPFGIRSLRVATNPTLGPNRITVDVSDVLVPSQTLNYKGTLQAVTLVGAPVVTGSGTCTRCFVDFNVNSSYVADHQLQFITLSYTTSAYLTKVIFNGTQSQTFPNLPTDTRVSVVQTLSIPFNSTNFPIELQFSKNPDGTGSVDMRHDQISVTFEWTNYGDMDAISLDT